MNDSPYEDPREQLFHKSMEEMLKIGQDEKVEPKLRIEALNELQKAYLTNKMVDTDQELAKTTDKTLNRAVDQVRKLTEEG